MADLSTNPQQMHVKISRELKAHKALNRALHPAALDELCRLAFANGWDDHEWLLTYALEGNDHPSVTNQAAVFVHRLREICSLPCPKERTPQPPDIREYLDEQARQAALAAPMPPSLRDLVRRPLVVEQEQSA